MIYSMEIGRNLRYLNEDRTGNYFIEGDTIDCYLKDGKRYTGTIIGIGLFKEDSESGSESVVCLDTSKSKRSYSSEIIFIKDITFVCRNQNNIENFPIEEEPDKDAFLDVFKGTGYEEKFAKVIYDRMKFIIAAYHIPVMKAAECAVYALDNQCSIESVLVDRCGIEF